MVEAVIRTADPRVPYRAVHASRGKIVRAEPIAALYEKGTDFWKREAAASLKVSSLPWRQAKAQTTVHRKLPMLGGRVGGGD